MDVRIKRLNYVESVREKVYARISLGVTRFVGARGPAAELFRAHSGTELEGPHPFGGVASDAPSRAGDQRAVVADLSRSRRA